MNFRSLPFRLGAGYTLVLGVTFLCVGAAAFYGLQHYLYLNLADVLKRRSAQVEQIVASAPAGVSQASIAQQIETQIAPELNNRFVRVTGGNGVVLYSSGAPADRSFDPLAVPPDLSLPAAATSVTQTFGQLHMMIRTAQVRGPHGVYRVDLGVTTAPMEAALDHLIVLLSVLLPTLVICAAVGGYLLVSWALRPVDRLSQTANHMSMQNLTLRLPALPTGDALERLSTALNHMLDRLRLSVQNSRRFIADASHELRTPLTVIKGELQEVLRTPELMAPIVRDRVGSVLEEVDRLEHLVSSLLSLSRMDAGEARSEWVEVDLAALARSTAEQMRLMAEDRGIEVLLDAAKPTHVRGDPSRLKQIIVNLLDNAIRFTGSGGTVVVRVAPDADGGILEVTDTGIGIPEGALAHVFDRFYRVDDARSREDGGAGLGLSIVRSICAAHGAQVVAESSFGRGSCFRVRFPVTASGVRAIGAAAPQ